jgi:hypothetical protein
MTIAIPVWLLWTLGVVGSVVGLLIIGGVIMLAMLGWAAARAIGGGLGW